MIHNFDMRIVFSSYNALRQFHADETFLENSDLEQ